MTTSQFKKLKKQIDKVLEQAEDDALKEGVLISSPEFQALLEKLKEKLLAEYGISLEEYEAIENEMEEKTLDRQDEAIQFFWKKGERTQAFSEARKKEFKQKTDELVADFKKEIENLNYLLKSSIEQTRKSALTKDDVINTIKPLIPKIPQHTDFDHLKILESLEFLNKKIKEIKSGDPKEDLFKLQSDFLDLFDKVKKIKIPNDYVQQSVLEPSVKDIMGAELNRILRSFQSQVYMVNKKLDDFIREEKMETPTGDIDGANTTFIVTHVPLWLTWNGQAIYETTDYPGYSRVGLTLTTNFIPSSGDLLRSHYK